MINQNYLKLKRSFSLSFQLAKANFKVKNEGSYLGVLWYILNPLLMFGLLLFLFSVSLGSDIPDYPLYLLVGIIILNFFQKTTIEATKIIQNNSHIFKSIKIPLEVLVASNILTFLFSHIFEIIILIVFLIIFNVSIYGIIFYPLILLLLYFFVFGASLLLSALAVYFADFKNIWPFTSTLIWFGTPIFYNIEGQIWIFYANLLNPMYYFVTVARDVIIYSKVPEPWLILGTIIYSILSLLIGFLIFNKLKNKFPEML
ncbi:MAG: hypothetical protein CMI53_03885 [Parcubacteria group bacterium]|nr:hypothetical protein [Parcubacteria group bacterium]|tara:strand:+ start:263 stop:1036 length:774 start_codon:yes stop_codon:yes gene_type:complete